MIDKRLGFTGLMRLTAALCLLPLQMASAQTEIAGPVSGEWTQEGSLHLTKEAK